MKSGKILMIVFVSSLFLLACTNNEPVGPGGGDGAQKAVVRVNAVPYAGNGLELEGEKDILDMQACLFQDGVITRVFNELDNAANEYRFPLENLTGKLYMIANLGEKVDLDAMLAADVTEDDFLQTTVDMGSQGQAIHFFTGAIELQNSDSYTYTVDMKRGVARFDLQVTSASQPIAVKKLELTNIEQQGYLIAPQAGLATPETSERATMAVDFEIPVSDRQQGLIYVYEQVNAGIQVLVTVDVAGKEKTLTKNISGNIERNSVYTIKVNKDTIDVDVNIHIQDWEDGTDTEIEA
ncbi:MAG: hypothetical protein IAA73_02815 [Bacteroidetes bacterium]|uniref:DUF4382 domain-containing protein n=1 Tax=Candidatus Gallipaludibacter merdavium TaxID=2840839 RepID=A0A9D9HSN1_9BACT|nr:hypothetical protein [Candidatus Gallipaludibacter merdavium]